MTSTRTHALDSALSYATLGYPVFPLRPDSKAPATKHGFKAATLDPSQLRRLFSTPRNIGLAPDQTTLVLDLDVSKDEGLPMDSRINEALDRYHSLVETYAELVDAPLATTPSLGRHLWLQVPPDTSQLKTGRWQGGDIRGLGRSYLAVPPSTINGAEYRWLKPLVPPQELPVASTRLIAYLTPARAPNPQPPITQPSPANLTRYVIAALRGEHEKVASAAQGGRNTTLHASAIKLGTLVGAGVLSKDNAFDALLDACRTSQLPDNEATLTIRSGLSYGMQYPRQFDRVAK